MAPTRKPITRALTAGIGVFAALASAACGGNDDGTSATVAASTTSGLALPTPGVGASSSTTIGATGMTGPTGSATTPAAANLPDCAGLPPAIGTPHTNCQLGTADSVITFDYSTPDQVDIHSGDQDVTEKLLNSPPGYPHIQDIDGDGTGELLIPVQLAATNTTTAVYHVDGLVHAGELPGAITPGQDGEIKTTASISAASSAVGFWQFSGTELQEIITVAVSKRPGDPECAIEGDVNRSGMSNDEATEHYCALARN